MFSSALFEIRVSSFQVATLETRLQRKEAECIDLQTQESLGGGEVEIFEKRIFALEVSFLTQVEMFPPHQIVLEILLAEIIYNLQIISLYNFKYYV